MKHDDYVEKKHYQTFEEIKTTGEFGRESWSARDLQPVLDYGSWDKFKRVIEKAMTACTKAGQAVEDHFSPMGKMVHIGSGAEREVEDFALSRYACYLIVQNGDPTKPVIANGQTYFAMQTRRRRHHARRPAYTHHQYKEAGMRTAEETGKPKQGPTPMNSDFQRPRNMADLLERYRDRVQPVLNMLLESPYFYQQDQL